MIDIRSFRFVIPPFIVFGIVLFGMFIDPNCNIKIIEQKFSVSFDRLGRIGPLLLSTVVLSFAFGFVISTVSVFFLWVLYLIRSRTKLWVFKGRWNGRAVNWEWDPQAQAKLEALFHLADWRKDGEFCEHAVLSKGAESLRDHVSRTWEFFQTNLNSLVALAMAIILCECLLEVNIGWGYWPISVFAFVLLCNAGASYKAAMRTDHLLLRNLERLSVCSPWKKNVGGYEE